MPYEYPLKLEFGGQAHLDEIFVCHMKSKDLHGHISVRAIIHLQATFENLRVGASSDELSGSDLSSQVEVLDAGHELLIEEKMPPFLW